MILWLVGMMGSGKTSSGKCAASKLGISFLDVDEQIADHQGQTVLEIFDSVGEDGFREIESRIIARIAASASSRGDDAIVATGGGSVLSTANTSAMSSTGRVIWLDGSAATLTAHLTDASRRPLLNGVENSEATLAKLRTARLPLYEDCADAVIEIDDLDVSAVAAAIEELWKTF